MLEYATIGNSAALGMLVLHDDATREFAYGPVLGLPGTRVGAFTQPLYDEARKRGWFRHQHEKRLEKAFCVRQVVGPALMLRRAR
jgi:hypothetical protein